MKNVLKYETHVLQSQLKFNTTLNIFILFSAFFFVLIVV